MIFNELSDDITWRIPDNEIIIALNNQSRKGYVWRSNEHCITVDYDIAREMMLKLNDTRVMKCFINNERSVNL